MATALTQPEPMNAITYHSKLRTTLKFADPLFVAGDAVSGKMEMECKTDKGLGIGIIMAELFAIEGVFQCVLSSSIIQFLCRTFFSRPFCYADIHAQ